MIEFPETLISNFLEALATARRGEPRNGLAHEVQHAPHKAHSLPTGKCSVYVFSICGAWGKNCIAGANFVLKIGKVGPNSNPRFQYQHYNPNSAGSNVAKSLLRSRILWPYLGISGLTEAHVGDWIRQNTDRDHFYLDGVDKAYLDDVERFVRGVLGPAFEGG